MPKGTVKWFNDHKGYGFIEEDGGCPNLFVHLSAVLPSKTKGFRPLKEGDHVLFDVEDTHTGPMAVNVTVS